jgi:hypothetical protein
MTDAELDQLAHLKSVDKTDQFARQSIDERAAFIAQQAARGATHSGATVKWMISFVLRQKRFELDADFEALKDVYRQAKRLNPARIREFGDRVLKSRLHDKVVQQLVNAILTPAYMQFAQDKPMRSHVEESIKNELQTMRSDFHRQVEIEARELDVAEKTSPSTAPHETIIYSVSGPNARFNINSTDSSTNVIQQAPTELFQAIREAIQMKLETDADRDTLLSRVDALEREVGGKSFAQKYAEFMAVAANHMAVLAPFVPALTQLLAG